MLELTHVGVNTRWIVHTVECMYGGTSTRWYINKKHGGTYTRSRHIQGGNIHMEGDTEGYTHGGTNTLVYTHDGIYTRRGYTHGGTHTLRRHTIHMKDQTYREK